jgi:hypothetical protein
LIAKLASVFGGKMSLCTTCGFCSNDIKELDEKVYCYGSCFGIYHTKCAKVSKTAFKVLNESCRNIKYLCDKCSNSDFGKINERLSTFLHLIREKEDSIKTQRDNLIEQEERLKIQESFLRNQEKNMNDVLSEISEIKNMIEKTNGELNKQNNSVKKYSDVLKKNLPEKNKLIVISSCDENENNKETSEKIKKSIDPTIIPVTNLRMTTKGKALIEIDNEANGEKIIEDVKQKMGKKYEIRFTKQINPQIKLIGLNEILTEEEILRCLVIQNDILNGTDSLKVIKIIENKRKINSFNIILEVTADLHERILLNGNLKIKWNRCKAIDNVNLIKCFKCCGYNHFADKCTNEIACTKCSGNHKFSECKNDYEKCINCLVANKNYNLNLDTDHASWSADCKVYQRKLELKKKLYNI